jgi:hypothetical protein
MKAVACASLVAAAVLAGCSASSDKGVALLSPLKGQRQVVSAATTHLPTTYDVSPGTDGRMFLVLDCIGDDGHLSATRADGEPWSPAHLTNGSPTATVTCRENGSRLALLVTGDAGVPIPLRIESQPTVRDWRVALTHQSPNNQ